MKIEIFSAADAVARKAAELIAAEARAAVKARRRFIVAVSGGNTPWQMLRALANEDVPWEDVNVVQVDERVAPAGHPGLTCARRSGSECQRLRCRADWRLPGQAPDDVDIPDSQPRTQHPLARDRKGQGCSARAPVRRRYNDSSRPDSARGCFGSRRPSGGTATESRIRRLNTKDRKSTTFIIIKKSPITS